MAKPKGTGSRSKKNGGADVPVAPVVNPTPEISAAPLRKDAEVKENKKPEARRNLIPINLDDEIRRRAYELWEQRGCSPGHENDDWLIAEAEILARYSVQRQHSA